jgi:hypothetical protein
MGGRSGLAAATARRGASGRDFLIAYHAGDLEADLAEPFDRLNFFDVAPYIAAFTADCP